MVFLLINLACEEQYYNSKTNALVSKLDKDIVNISLNFATKHLS